MSDAPLIELGSRPRTVVIGAGFGGLAAARCLGGSPVDVVVIDRENHHVFQPLVYEVAMVALAAPNVSAPIRSVLSRYPNTRVVMADACAIWGAGVRPTALVHEMAAPHDAQGRVLVEKDLSVPGHPETFVVGDVAHFEQNGQTLPGIAPVAIQQGRAAARAIDRTVRGKERRAFHYFNKGMLATIGRRRAVGIIFGLHVTGFVAWLAWATVHVAYLVGFRNRLAVMIEWIWNYLTFKRGARVIEGLHPPHAPTTRPC